LEEAKTEKRRRARGAQGKDGAGQKQRKTRTAQDKNGDE
jgi:hypothetical protein